MFEDMHPTDRKQALWGFALFVGLVILALITGGFEGELEMSRL